MLYHETLSWGWPQKRRLHLLLSVHIIFAHFTTDTQEYTKESNAKSNLTFLFPHHLHKNISVQNNAESHVTSLFLQQTLGKITNYVWDGQTPAITIQYSTRREAEKAMNEGRTLGDRLLTLTWAFDATLPITSQLPASAPTPSPSQQPQLSPHSYANVTPHSTTALLSPDETLVGALG